MLTLPPTKCCIVHNGARIGKLEKEVLPPQCVAGGRSSSPWVGWDVAGVAGGVVATVASKLREAVGAGWVEGASSTGGGTGEA